MSPTTTPPSTAPPSLPPNLTTHTQLFSPISLDASPHLPALFKLINHCFNISHNPPGHSYLPYSPTSRLKTHTQLSEEIGPDGFTIILLARDTSPHIHVEEEENAKIIATASAKPYIPSSPSPSNNNNPPGNDNASSEKLFKRQPGTDKALAAYADLPKWEILCMVVEPTLQGRGVAGWLMGETIEEIKRRVGGKGGDEEGQGERRCGGGGGVRRTEKANNGTGDDGDDGDGSEEGKEEGNNHGDGNGKGKGEVLLMLSSMQELNEGYYKKRGWQTTSVRKFPPGTMGSRDGFGVVEMMKAVSL